MSRVVELALIFIALQLLCFGISDGVPFNARDAFAAGILGVLAGTQPRPA